ncbi:MAG: long-chain fatty acid--CoA ligase [Actinomycetota bacterium]
MLGLMQDMPLTTTMLFRRGEQYWGDRTVATRTATGIERTSFADLAVHVRRLAGALDGLGLSADARVGSLGWNTGRHLGLYFAVPGSGRILHTINIRYFPDQITYSVNHAEDEAVFVDRSLLPLFRRLIPHLDTVRHIIVMDDGASAEMPDDPRIIDYDDLVAGSDEVDFSDRISDENQAAALCYTTGTTGNPKGVLYSHRSTWLHANAGLGSYGARVTDRDNVLPVVPMFHAMAWGMPYTAWAAGARITMPGPDLSPAGLVSLIESERVTYAAGVPTIWMGMLPLLADHDVSSLDRVMCGGSAVPKALSEGWRDAIGVPITQGWGMTETSPVASMSTLRAEHEDASEAEQADVRATQGMALAGIELRIADAETGEVLPWDDKATGEVQARGPWVARQYYRTDSPGEQFTADGWLRTGDVAAVSPQGYLRLVDRTKDLIKSGGEWISSVDVENEIMSHPKVAEAAVIALPHPKWMERPFACVVTKPGETMTRDEVLDYLRERLSGFQVPDDVAFVEEIPKTSVGKFSKKTLRDRFADHPLPTV